MFWFFRPASRHRKREEIDLLVDIYGQNAFIIKFLKESFMTVSTEVQKILDQARQSSSLTQSVHLGMQGLQQQVADLKAKIDSLPAGNVLGDDDKAALQEAAGQLDNTINTLKSDIPANVTEDGQQGQDLGKPATGGTPQPDQSGSAQPLPGTGPQS